MYRGYIEVKDKKAIEPFKGVGTLKTIDEVKELDGYAGVLAEDSILIDIDDMKQAEILMGIVEDKQLDCNVFETTRGMHFVFKNNGVESGGNDLKLAIGIIADVKVGSKNSYQVLKRNGEERFHSWETPDNEVQQLPKYLVPVESKTDFMNLEDGDGRNSALFSYILTLQTNDFDKDEVRETLHLINDYVLLDPLPDSEIETLSRDDAFSEEIFYEKNKFLAAKFANFLMNTHHVKRINGELHIYKDGIYVPNKRTIEKVMVERIPELHSSTRREVLHHLDIVNDIEAAKTNASFIAFRNGVLDVRTDELHPHDPMYNITNMIPWDYNPNAYDEVTDMTLNKMAVEEEGIRLLLEEVIGYTFYRRNELGKAFILTGDKSNGKSTYLSLIEHILGKENISSLDISELGERFLTAQLAGKLSNIGDDIESGYINATSTFKKLVTGDTVPAERKHEHPFQFESYAKLIFSANSTPQIGGGKDAGAVARRLVIIPFNASFSPDDDDFDPYIKDKLTTQQATEYLIKLGVEGLKRVLLNSNFTKSKSVQDETDKYEQFADPILGFIKYYEDELESILELKGKSETDDVYMNFNIFCRNTYGDKYEPLVRDEFAKQLNIKTKYKTESIRTMSEGIRKRVNFVVRK